MLKLLLTPLFSIILHPSSLIEVYHTPYSGREHTHVTLVEEEHLKHNNYAFGHLGLFLFLLFIPSKQVGHKDGFIQDTRNIFDSLLS